MSGVKLILLAGLSQIATSAAAAGEFEVASTTTTTTVEEDPWQRAVHLVQQLTFSEKLQFVQGNTSLAESKPSLKGYVGLVGGVERLNIPDLKMNDGPQGFRARGTAAGTSTQWPSGLTVAKSWNRTMMYSKSPIASPLHVMSCHVWCEKVTFDIYLFPNFPNFTVYSAVSLVFQH